MAMGLGSFGRRRGYIIYLGTVHVLGATLGGALVGFLLGSLGAYLSLYTWRPFLLLAIILFALWQHQMHHPAILGLKHQVPREWANSMPSTLCYLLWGILLGSGVATFIPYSALPVLFTAQLTSGPLVGLLSGAIFGGTRQLVALSPLLLMPQKVSTNGLPTLLPILKAKMHYLNIVWIIIAGIVLIAWAR